MEASLQDEFERKRLADLRAVGDGLHLYPIVNAFYQKRP